MDAAAAAPVLTYDAAAAAAAAAAGGPVAGELHVAPMLAVTDRYFRRLCRLLSRRAVLWSEMVHADAVTHNAARLLPFDREEEAAANAPPPPREVLQLGGSCPATLARAAACGAGEYGYGEINLNVRRSARTGAPCGCVGLR